MAKPMNDGLVLRQMTAADLDAVLAIETASFSVPWSRQSFENELRNERAYYIVGELSGEVVAYMGMWFILDEADIMNVAVLPALRGQRIGQRMLSYAIEQALAQGCRSLTLEVRSSNAAAQSLYTKLGFVKSGIRKNYYENPREDAVIMWYQTK